MKTVNLRPHLKRNILIAAVLLLVCVAAFLNWSYNQRWGDGNSAMADAEDEMTTAVNAADGAPEETVSAALPASVSGYFSEARLTRQQSRDQALSLLETAACAESASQDVIDSAMNEITGQLVSAGKQDRKRASCQRFCRLCGVSLLAGLHGRSPVRCGRPDRNAGRPDHRCRSLQHRDDGRCDQCDRGEELKKARREDPFALFLWGMITSCRFRRPRSFS